MPAREEKAAHLRRTIAKLESRLEDLQARMPAHSIPPAMQTELDELDEQLAAARLKLKQAGEDLTS